MATGNASGSRKVYGHLLRREGTEEEARVGGQQRLRSSGGELFVQGVAEAATFKNRAHHVSGDHLLFHPRHQFRPRQLARRRDHAGIALRRTASLRPHNASPCPSPGGDRDGGFDCFQRRFELHDQDSDGANRIGGFPHVRRREPRVRFTRDSDAVLAIFGHKDESHMQ